MFDPEDDGFSRRSLGTTEPTMQGHWDAIEPALIGKRLVRCATHTGAARGRDCHIAFGMDSQRAVYVYAHFTEAGAVDGFWQIDCYRIVHEFAMLPQNLCAGYAAEKHPGPTIKPFDQVGTVAR